MFVASFWLFWAAVVLSSSLLHYFVNNWQCDREDFGACALQNLFGGLFLIVLALIVFLAFPLILLGIIAVLGFIGIFRKDGSTIWAKVCLIHDLIAVSATILFCLVLWGYLGS